jgi:hypothetical protein
MFSFNFGHRFTSVVALALLGLALSAPAAQAAQTRQFAANGVFQMDADATHGRQFFFTAQGNARPGGSFDSTGYGHGNLGNYFEWVVQTLDFGNGNTLSVYIEDDLTSFDPFERTGSYVITAGTGKFAGASGSGTFTGVPVGDGTGAFELDGTISY